jgi:hypothetical protein
MDPAAGNSCTGEDSGGGRLSGERSSDPSTATRTAESRKSAADANERFWLNRLYRQQDGRPMQHHVRHPIRLRDDDQDRNWEFREVPLEFDSAIQLGRHQIPTTRAGANGRV